MRLAGLMLALLVLEGCGVAKHIVGTDQCMAPTGREANITKRVWK